MRIQLSQQQQAIINWGRTSKQSLIIRAYAGCAKTTTGIELCKVLPGLTFFGAYNKSIAEEIAAKLSAIGISRSKVESATFHSVGYRAWRNVHSAAKLDADKCANILTDIVEEDRRLSQQLRIVKRKNVLALVSFAKQQCFGVVGCPEIGDVSAWEKLAEEYSLDEELEDYDKEMGYLVTLAGAVYVESMADLTKTVDFDDMLLAPLIGKVPVPVKDNVIIDEAQDTNAARRLLALRMLRPGTGRMVAIGDPNQGIYRFAGADLNSMDLIQAATNAITLPLSVTYRCPKTVVQAANRFVADFVAHESAPEGEIIYVDYKPRNNGGTSLNDLMPKPGDAVLCRNTRPLVELLFVLLEKNIPVQLKGSSPAQAYINLIKSMDVESIPQLVSKLNNYVADQAKVLESRPEKFQRIVDKVETILSIASQCQRKGGESVAQLSAEITRIFDTDNRRDNAADTSRVQLRTIHSAKGLEWERVYILGANLFMPSKWAKKPADIQQEHNLEYVAITRTKQTLVWIQCKKEDFGAGVNVPVYDTTGNDSAKLEAAAKLLEGESLGGRYDATGNFTYEAPDSDPATITHEFLD